MKAMEEFFAMKDSWTWLRILALIAALLTVALVGVALADTAYNYVWDTSVNDGNYDDGANWESIDAGYPNGTGDTATISGRGQFAQPRKIHLISECIGKLTASKKVEFDNKGESAETLTVVGRIEFTTNQNDDATITITEGAKLETAGTCP